DCEPTLPMTFYPFQNTLVLGLFWAWGFLLLAQYTILYLSFLQLSTRREKKGESVATLTKAQIVEKLFAKNMFTKGECAQIIDSLFELIKHPLESGDDVLISGFGKFCVRDKNQRRGRNPQTGDPMMLDPRKVVTFKCSGVLREAINKDER
ncbi:MAG: integration host factor subunit alpha, partial [Desulfoferrobacter sp.]